MSADEQAVADLRAELDEAIAERNRLWEELQRRNANEHELDYYRRMHADITGSLSWRLTEPLRALTRFARDPAGALKRLARRVLRRLS